MIKYIADETLGSYYRMNGDQFEWQPMVKGVSEPYEEEWGIVEEDLVGTDKVVYADATRTLSEVYTEFIRPQLEDSHE